MRHLSITLDDEHAAKLARLAQCEQAQPAAVASSLLSAALDEFDADPRHVAELLDGISGSRERAHRGLRQAQRGETLGLDEL